MSSLPDIERIHMIRDTLTPTGRLEVQREHGAWLTANLPPELKPARDALCRRLTVTHCGIGMASEIIAAIGVLICAKED